MSKFIALTAVFLLSMLLLLTPYPSIFAISVFIYLGLVIYGSTNIRSGFFLDVICSLKDGAGKLLITFDDGPHPVNTPELLRILRSTNARALFFVTGIQAEKYPEICRNIVYEGHLIGNHTYSHSSWFPFFSKKRMTDEIEKTSEIIEKITGIKPKFFRPPFGITNPTIACALKQTGFITVGWSLRSLDTVIRNKEKILKNVTKKVSGGDIILFHDSIPETIEVLEPFIVHCVEKGFDFIGSDDLSSGELL